MDDVATVTANGVGARLPVRKQNVAEVFGIGPRTLWIVLLFAYAFVASRIPVWILLQPRDYINSHQLFIALGVIFLGLAIGLDRIDAPVLNTALPFGAGVPSSIAVDERRAAPGSAAMRVFETARPVVGDRGTATPGDQAHQPVELRWLQAGERVDQLRARG